MEIIRACPADATILSAIAWEAKAHWGYPSSWLERWRDLLTITPKFIDANETFVAVENDRMIGFYSLLQTPKALRLEHLWVLPENMGRGVGRMLFEHAAERAAALGALSLTIESDPNAGPFYRHLGAIRSGTIESQIDGVPRQLPILTLDLNRGRGR